ncbi:MAG: PucR family transcriptional regulator [Acidimicrobiales bacterium]
MPSLASRGRPALPRLARALLDELPSLTDRLVYLIRESEECYRQLEEADVRERVASNLGSTLSDLAESRCLTVASQADTARHRAEQGIPLASVLHAFRLGFMVLWEGMVARATDESPELLRELGTSATGLWQAIDAHSEAVTAAYRDTLVDIARRDEQYRTLLLDALFEGRLGEWTGLGGSPAALDLPAHGPYVAVSAETGEIGAEKLPRVGQLLRLNGVRSTWRLRSGEHVGIIAWGPLRDQSEAWLRQLLLTDAAGPIGLSPCYDELAGTNRALGIATLARACMPSGVPAVTTIDDDPVAALVVVSPDLAGFVSDGLLRPLLELASEERSTLLSTLSTWFARAGSSGATADHLGCHRNTVRNRLRRVEDLTGRSLEDPTSTSELFLALRAVTVLQPGLLTTEEVGWAAEF